MLLATVVFGGRFVHHLLVYFWGDLLGINIESSVSTRIFHIHMSKLGAQMLQRLARRKSRKQRYLQQSCSKRNLLFKKTSINHHVQLSTKNWKKKALSWHGNGNVHQFEEVCSIENDGFPLPILVWEPKVKNKCSLLVRSVRRVLLQRVASCQQNGRKFSGGLVQQQWVWVQG